MIIEHQQDYYHALEQSGQQADSTPFIHFMLSVILQTLTQNAPVNASENAPVKSPVDATAQIAGLKTPDAILRLLLQSPELTRPQLAEIIGKYENNIEAVVISLTLN